MPRGAGFRVRRAAPRRREELMRMLPLLAVAWLISLPIVGTDPACAQTPTRTWVSGVGDDGNTCSRTAPCKTFTGAIAKTAAAGEINCLDPGDFGTLFITKSITIDCTGVFRSEEHTSELQSLRHLVC